MTATGGLASLGNYKVELDAGFLRDEFILGESTLGGPDTLGGSTSFFDVTEYIVSVNISRGRRSQDQQFGAATASITIDDLKAEDKFSVANQNSPYWNAQAVSGSSPAAKYASPAAGSISSMGSSRPTTQSSRLTGTTW